MAPGSPYKPLIDGAILETQEGGILFRLKTKWWKQKRGGGACEGGGGDGGAVAELGLPNVAGVFLVTVIGEKSTHRLHNARQAKYFLSFHIYFRMCGCLFPRVFGVLHWYQEAI